MATGKAKKKDKLRHAEYYDFQAIQDKLYADSNKGKVFKHLVEILYLICDYPHKHYTFKHFEV